MAKGILYSPAVDESMAIRSPQPRGPQVPPPAEGSYAYKVVSSLQRDPASGMYPGLDDLLKQYGCHWTMVHKTLAQAQEGLPVHEGHTFGLTAPTFRQIDDGGVTEYYVDGIPDEKAFQSVTGIVCEGGAKGEFVRSKRMSRFFRPFRCGGTFNPDEVRIYYLDAADYERLGIVDPVSGKKLLDGSGVVSRKFLEGTPLAEGLSPAAQNLLNKRKAESNRVEYTLQSGRGQDKGHAQVAAQIVIDGMEYDFILPLDTKPEVKFTSRADGTSPDLFVGFDLAVKGKAHTRFDIQSVINLGEFVPVEQYAGWMADAREVFAQRVESGDVADAMSRIDADETLDDVEDYGTRCYFASGGHPMHFAHHVESFMNLRLQQLNHANLEKLRMEFPGFREYMSSACVGRLAGVEGLDFPPGQVLIDHKRGTVWFNDEDYLRLPDSTKGKGVTDITGGSDQDDGFWILPFEDYDSHLKVLLWRSPNQLGEYVIMQPAAGSAMPEWETASGEIRTDPPKLDSRKLPPRIDLQDYTYTHADEAKFTPPHTFEEALERAIENEGALGMVANAHMLEVAVYGHLPDVMPAPLEWACDSQVKDGRPTEPMKAWAVERTRHLLKNKVPIPSLLLGDKQKGIKSRLSYPRTSPDAERNYLPKPVRTKGHRLDKLAETVHHEIAMTEARKQELAARARSPRQVLDAAFMDEQAIEDGANFNSLYARYARKGDYEGARKACEQVLDGLSEADQNRLLLGAAYNIALSSDEQGRPKSDASFWQKGERNPETGKRARGIEHRMIRALRSIGVLDEIAETDSGLVVYPGAVINEPPVQTISIRNVDLNYYKQVARAKGLPVPAGTLKEQWAAVSQTDAALPKRLKAQIRNFTRTRFPDKVLVVAPSESGEMALWTEQGVAFGTLDNVQGLGLQPGDRIRLGVSRATDGNLQATWGPIPQSDEEETSSG